MHFNTDTTKQAQEVIFNRKYKKEPHLPLLFNNVSVARTSSHKHSGIMLENQLKSDGNLEMVSGKIRKTIGLLCKLQNFLPRAAVSTAYKSDPILIMVIYFMIKRITCLFTKSWNPFSTMPASP